jgi:hypothetical protein
VGRAIRLEVQDGHAGTPCGEPVRDCSADPGSAAGDDGYETLKIRTGAHL